MRTPDSVYMTTTTGSMRWSKRWVVDLGRSTRTLTISSSRSQRIVSISWIAVSSMAMREV